MLLPLCVAALVAVLAMQRPAAPAGEQAFDFTAPAIRFTAAKKAAQRDRGQELVRLVREEGAVYALHFRDMQREATNPFRIIARNATLWFRGRGGLQRRVGSRGAPRLQ
jgi:hypothetical protein